MFPAYSTPKETNETSKPVETNSKSGDWPSYGKTSGHESASSATSDDEIEMITEFVSSKSSKKAKKEKKRKHKKRKKHHHDEKEQKYIPLKDPVKIVLVDDEYLKFFATFTKEQVKKFQFFDDVPGLNCRNAFKIDRHGDKNNICFDTVNYKQVPLYYPPALTKSEAFENRLKKSKLTKKQMRKKLLQQVKQNRYYIKRMKSDEIDTKQQHSSTQSSTLSNKMWLYLQMKNELDETNEIKNDKSTDYVKYLSENKHDINKWLEFIEYQSSTETAISMALYERKVAIYEKAIGHNSSNFQLKIEFMKFKAQSADLTNYLDSFERIEKDFLSLLINESFTAMKSTAGHDQMILNLFEIWFEYLRFLVNNNSTILSYEKIRKTFQRCFEFFLQSKNKVISNNVNKVFFLNRILKLVELYGSFQAKCGYVEKTVGIYQALLDFNLCTSSSTSNNSKYTNLDLVSRKTLFELFWDIGLPKFGESHSTGWLNCLENRDSIFEKMELLLDENKPIGRESDQLDFYEANLIDNKNIRIEYRWLEIERLRSVLNWYPFYAQMSAGESSDDCADPDRLLSFDEDISFSLFDLNENEEIVAESLKFKLLICYLKFLNIVTWDNTHESIDDDDEEEDFDYARYLNDKFTFFSSSSTPISNNFQFHDLLFSNLKNENSNLTQMRVEHSKKSIEHIRNIFQQVSNFFHTLKYQTFINILKWKFEFQLVVMQSRLPAGSLYFDVKESFLLNQAKNDLSLEKNRSNFRLWQEYGVLKCLLSNLNNSSSSKWNNMKESRKVFDTLLTTSASATQTDLDSCIDIYSLCVQYAELELGMYQRQFDVVSSSSDDIDVGFNVQNDYFIIQKHQDGNLFSRLFEILTKNCLYKQNKSSKTTSFTIEISSATKTLIIKRDFEREYDRQVAELRTNASSSFKLEKKLFLFHKVYMLVLISLNDMDKLLQVNDMLLKDSAPFSSLYRLKILEFYLCILNYLYFSRERMSKFMLKTKLFAIVRSTILTTSGGGRRMNKAFIRYLQTMLTRLQTATYANPFCTQLLESNDMDMMIEHMCRKVNSSTMWLSFIHVHLYKLNRNAATATDELKSSYGGIHYQLRRLFEQALKYKPKSFLLWHHYMKFEKIYLHNNNKILYIYYQSIRNLPFCKAVYLNAIEYLPEKFIEIMNLLSNREIRIRLPVEELNLLLEPIRKRSELDNEDVDDEDDDIDFNDDIAEEQEEVKSSKSKTSSDEEEMALVESDYDDDSTPSEADDDIMDL